MQHGRDKMGGDKRVPCSKSSNSGNRFSWAPLRLSVPLSRWPVGVALQVVGPTTSCFAGPCITKPPRPMQILRPEAGRARCGLCWMTINRSGTSAE